MRPSNEVPAVNLAARAPVTIRIHRADSQPTYTVDLLVDYNFPGPVTITGLHIHRAANGFNGPVVIDSGVSPSKPQISESGSGSISIQVSGETTPDLAALLSDIETASGEFYVNLHTTAFPSGAMRGQLAAAQQTVVMGLMSPANEVPAIAGLDASAVGTVIATVTRDADGAISSAEVLFDLNYRFADSSAVTLTGLHIHPGPAGMNGPVVLNSGLTQRTVDPAGNLRLRSEMDVMQPQVVAALEALFTDPSGYYINLHTTTNPNGAMRAQLARASRSSEQMGFAPPRPHLTDPSFMPLADGQFILDVLRTPAGNIAAAMVTVDLDYKNFEPDTPFRSISSGGVSISLDSKTASAGGLGNIYEIVTLWTPAQLAPVETLLQRGASGGSLRTSNNSIGHTVSGNIAGTLAISALASAAAADAPNRTAPGGLISLFGSFPVNGVDVTGLAQPWPTSLNGAWVTIADRRIPLGYISRRQINAQIPPDLPPGPQTVYFWVKNDGRSTGDYRSAAFQFTLSRQAPAIFLTPQGPLIKHGDGTLVTATQPARAGEMVHVYVTGIAPSAGGAYQDVSSTFGFTSQPSLATTVNSTTAAPGLPGIQIVAVRVPLGLGWGERSLQISASGTPSNIVSLWVE
jgi:uncharacterized protein (TIGR03437 family)